MKEYINSLRYNKKKYINVCDFQYMYIKDITVFEVPHLSGKELKTYRFYQNNKLCKKTNKEIYIIPDAEEENLKFNPFFEDLRMLKQKNKMIIIFEEDNSFELELSYIVLVMEKKQRVPKLSVPKEIYE